MTETSVRFPAEWEPQSAILIAWPHAGTDWADRLGEVEETYIALVQAITRFQPVLICVADDDIETYAEMRLRSNRVDMDRVRFVTVAYDDTWLRDSGPITLRDLVGLGIDKAIVPAAIGKPLNTPYYAVPAITIDALNDRIEIDAHLEDLRANSPDPYVATRELYLRQRKAEIAAICPRKGDAPVDPALPPRPGKGAD